MGSNTEITIKIKAEADPSLNQVPTQVNQALEKTVQAAKSVPQDLNQQFTAALKNIEAQSKASSDAIVAELRQITGSVTAFSTQVAQGHSAIANSLNQIVGAGSGVKTASNQIKEGMLEAEAAAYAAEAFTSIIVRTLSESVTHGTELLKNLDEVKDRLVDITHDTAQSQSIIQSTSIKALENEFGVDGMRKASVQLALFHQDAIKNLKPVADLAAYAGKGIEETGAIVGRALEGQKKAYGVLKSQYGIEPAALVRYGAELDNAGNIAVKTATQIDKASKALETWIKVYAEGASQPDSLEGKLTAAGNAAQLLGEELAKPMLPVIQSLTDGVKDLSSYLIKMPDEFKGIAAGLGTFSGGMAMAVGAVIALAGPISQVISLWKGLKVASEEASAAAAAANSWTIGAGNSAIQAASKTGMMAKAASTLGLEVGTLAGAFASLGPVILAAVAILGTAWYEIEKYKQEQIALGAEIAKESKHINEANKEWKDYVNTLNEAGKSQGVVAKTSSDTSKELQSISEAIDKIDVEKLNAIFTGHGWNAENFKKVADKAKSDATAAEQQLELLEKVGHTVETTKNKVRDKEGNEYVIESKRLNLSTLTPEEQAQYKSMVKDPGSISELVELRKQKQEEYNKLQERSISLNDTYKKSFSEPERMLIGMKERDESSKNLLTLSARAKGTENLTEKLTVLNEQVKINEKEFKNIHLNIPNNIPDLLKYLEKLTPSQATLRGIAEDQLKLLVEAKETKVKIDKDATNNRIKEIERERNAVQQEEQDGLQAHKVTAEQKLAIDKQSLSYIEKVSSGSLLHQQNPEKQFIEVGGTKYDLTSKKVEKFSGIGPKTEDQQLLEDQQRYNNDLTFRKYIDDKRLSDKKKITSEEKSIESDNLKKLEVENENFLSSRREATKNDYQAQISDLNFIAAKYQENANLRVISEEAAAKKIAEINKKMADLEVKSDEQRFNSQIKLNQEHQKTSGIRLQHLEKELQAGKDVQGAIISEVKKRLDYEMQMIDLKAQKELENSEHTIAAQEAIFWGAQNAKHDALEKEKSYIDSIIKKEESALNSIESRTKQFGGFQSLNAFGAGKSMDEIPSISGFSSQIDINAKTKSQTQLQSYSDSLKSQINSMGILNTSLTTLNTSVNNLTSAIAGGSSSAGESMSPADMMTESPMKAAGWSKAGFDAGTLDDMASMFGQLAVNNNKSQTANVQQIFNIGGRGGVPPSAELKQVSKSMSAAVGRMASNNGILKTMGAGWGFDTFSQGGWGFLSVSKDEE